MQETTSYPAGWGRQLDASLSAVHGVRVVFANPAAVIYTCAPAAGHATGAGVQARPCG